MAEGCHSPRALHLKWLLYSGVSKAELANLSTEAQLIPVKEACQGSLNQVLNWKKSITSKRSFSSWPAQLIKGLVLCQPRCCSHCTLTELCHISPALTPDTQSLWPSLAFAHTEGCQAVASLQGSHTDLLVLNTPHLTWKTWAAITSVLSKDRPGIDKHTGKPQCTHPPEPRIYHNSSAIPTAVAPCG